MKKSNRFKKTLLIGLYQQYLRSGDYENAHIVIRLLVNKVVWIGLYGGAKAECDIEKIGFRPMYNHSFTRCKFSF